MTFLLVLQGFQKISSTTPWHNQLTYNVLLLPPPPSSSTALEPIHGSLQPIQTLLSPSCMEDGRLEKLEKGREETRRSPVVD